MNLAYRIDRIERILVGNGIRASDAAVLTKMGIPGRPPLLLRGEVALEYLSRTAPEAPDIEVGRIPQPSREERLDET